MKRVAIYLIGCGGCIFGIFESDRKRKGVITYDILGASAYDVSLCTSHKVFCW